MSVEATIPADDATGRLALLRWPVLLSGSAVAGLFLGVAAVYVSALTPLADLLPGSLRGLAYPGLFVVQLACAFALGRLAGGFAMTMGLRSATAKRRAAMIGIAAYTYGYLAFHGVAHRTLPSPVLSLKALGGYIGTLLGGQVYGFWLVLMLCGLLGAFVIAANAATRVRQRLYLPSPELPLLRRELTELSNRARTYIVRVLGAAGILFLVVDRYQSVLAVRLQSRSGLGFSGPAQFLGMGEEIFATVVPTLFIIISLLLPALCCASVTSEKESNTIGTLLLTRLSPGTIVLEKFGSRLIPMLTLLLLTFPVLAHVYALGGVDTQLLIGTIWLLLCQCFLIAAMAIFCSAWFGTTVSAFVCSYVLVGVFAAMTYSLQWDSFVPSAIWQAQFRVAYESVNWLGVGLTAAPSAGPFIGSIPSLIVTVIFLTTARLVLVRRAFPSHSSLTLKFFRALDRFFKAINDRATGGFELVADSDHPPEDDPIAWRERTRKALGKARYLVRVLLLLELPVLLICVIAATASARSAFEGLYILQAIVWTLCTLIVAVRAATLMSSERSRQTLEALLVAPFTAREIIDQKVLGMRRLVIVMAVPVLTINFTHFLIHVETTSVSAILTSLPRPLMYLTMSTVSTFVFLALFTWISVGLGTKIHSQTKAVITSAVFLALWVMTPVFVSRLLTGVISDTSREMIGVLSPFGTIRATELFLIEYFLNDQLSSYRSIVTTDTPKMVLAGAAILGQLGLLLLVRGAVRRGAPRLLQRRDQTVIETARTVSVAGTPEGTSE